MPLYVTKGKLQLGEPGQLAAQRACCCDEEGDNPEDCVCPDLCSYQIQEVSPVASAALPALPCQFNADGEPGEIVPYSSDCYDADPTLGGGGSEGAGVSRAGNSLLIIHRRNYVAGVDIGPAFFPPNLGIQLFIQVALGCDPATGQVHVSVYRSGAVELGPNLGGGFGGEFPTPGGCNAGSISTLKYAQYDVTTECKRLAQKSCAADSSTIRAAYASMPITIVVNAGGTSLGAWDFDETYTQGDTSCIQNCYDEEVENFSATFRITQRQSCQPVDCSCGVSLNGMKAVLDGTELTLGTAYDETTSEDGYDRRVTHFELGGIYYFTIYKILPGNLFGDELAVELFCDVDDEADPPVARWYVQFTSKCREFDGQGNYTAETTKTEIGYFVCGLGEFCEGLAADQPVPLGSPIEIEEVPGSPVTTDGLNPCTPPARPSLTLSCE